MRNIRIVLPERLEDFRDQQKNLCQQPDISPEVAYQRILLWLLAEIACRLGDPKIAPDLNGGDK
jgi:hypothetical protein